MLTELNAIQFADETVRLGEDFMDAYEDPRIHIGKGQLLLKEQEKIFHPIG